MSDYTGFHWSIGVYRTLLDFIGLNKYLWIIKDNNGLYRTILDYTTLYTTLFDYTERYWTICENTGPYELFGTIYRTLQDYTGL